MGKATGKSHSNKSTKPKKGMETQVVVAIITATTTIILALLTFPPILEFFEKEPTATPISMVTEPPTATDEATMTPIALTTEAMKTVMPTLTASETLFATVTQIPTSTATATPGLLIGMDVQLVADITSGKSPLKVNFDARSSFLRDAEGKIYKCGGGLCNYTWYVYQNSKLVNDPERGNNGTFGYKFGKGDYRVVVRVCRGQGDSDCAFDAEEISVK